MKVYSLTGRSGTGKSYRAQELCRKKGIDAIIDDGLFIMQGSMEGGRSAKREPTRLGAVRTALFSEESHRAAVVEKIAEKKPSSLLIVATSDRMADIISDRLHLPLAEERIYIEDIATPEERALAAKQRHSEGKHVIPASTMQVKRDFAGYFLDPLKLWKRALNASERAGLAIRKKGIGAVVREWGRDTGKTVVRPTYSYMGDFVISERVISDICVCAAVDFPAISRVRTAYSNTSPEHLLVYALVDMDAHSNLMEMLCRYQKRIVQKIERMTAFHVEEVNIEVADLT